MMVRLSSTPEAIRAEIADLARRRDAMLRKAPRIVFLQRLVLPVVLAIMVAGLVPTLRHGTPTQLFVLLTFTTLLALVCVKLWRPLQPTDLWGAANRLDYEGSGPHELQRRIDALRATLDEG